jgi:hypothetical protein
MVLRRVQGSVPTGADGAADVTRNQLSYRAGFDMPVFRTQSAAMRETGVSFGKASSAQPARQK